jgi:hypothetical protein
MKDGGSAFPVYEESRFGESSEFSGGMYCADSGMTLRDWFAGQALSGCCCTDFEDKPAMAHWCYQMADAMIAAREVK